MVRSASTARCAPTGRRDFADISGSRWSCHSPATAQDCWSTNAWLRGSWPLGMTSVPSFMKSAVTDGRAAHHRLSPENQDLEPAFLPNNAATADNDSLRLPAGAWDWTSFLTPANVSGRARKAPMRRGLPRWLPVRAPLQRQRRAARRRRSRPRYGAADLRRTLPGAGIRAAQHPDTPE